MEICFINKTDCHCLMNNLEYGLNPLKGRVALVTKLASIMELSNHALLLLLFQFANPDFETPISETVDNVIQNCPIDVRRGLYKVFTRSVNRRSHKAMYQFHGCISVHLGDAMTEVG